MMSESEEAALDQVVRSSVRHRGLGSENHPRGRSRAKTGKEQCSEVCEEGYRSLNRSEGAQAGWLSGGTGLVGDERGGVGVIK